MRIRVLPCVLCLLFSASAAHAQATRTWVSGDSAIGDDAHPCSRTAPCKTFTGAQIKTTDGGYINVVDPGGFGAITINKGLTIDGDGSHAGILAATAHGITVNAPAKTVVIRNLSIEGSASAANGIRIIAATRVVIENVTISNFVQNGILVSSDTEVVVNDATIKNIGDQGIYAQMGKVTVNRTSVTGTGVGILAGASAIITAKHTVSSHNETGFGAAYSAASQLNMEGCVSSDNVYGALALKAATLRMSDSMIVNSTATALFNDGGSFLLTWGNNRFAGNASDGAFTGSIMLR